MSTPQRSNEGGKLQELYEKWGAKSAALLLALCAWIYVQDRNDNAARMSLMESRVLAEVKAVQSRTAANERSIGRLQEGKASREELKAAVDSIAKDNQRSRDDLRDVITTLRTDLIQRMDIIAQKR